ncbi:anti-sigma-factor antagonist [Azospirillum sp. B510]|uniref:STAS domain-containing protein n=1 Tax=Azospirillum sp. (strain B510) TaxID=137722 RepID=UPI0001C4C124|nr:STAS domain-containing protein [Azospirillum sp. B510]BAI72987.1 anti-sigma-factor antagonist [Azospirillum sp. B510]
MDYGIEVRDLEAVVSMRGRLTFNDHSKLRSLIGEMGENARKRQVLDLSALEFVDSAGIGMLLIAREEMERAAKQFVLRGAAGQVKRVLTVAQLAKIVPIED